MTKEEAKNYIENVFPVLNTKMREAIKALEQEPSGDVINRQDAIRICEERGHDNSAYYIRNLPPVTAQPKTDTWSIKDVADTLAKHGLIVESEE